MLVLVGVGRTALRGARTNSWLVKMLRHAPDFWAADLYSLSKSHITVSNKPLWRNCIEEQYWDWLAQIRSWPQLIKTKMTQFILRILSPLDFVSFLSFTHCLNSIEIDSVLGFIGSNFQLNAKIEERLQQLRGLSDCSDCCLSYWLRSQSLPLCSETQFQ